MMLSIRPGSTFPIVRQIADPTDSATYYVRAVVRDSVTGDTLATVNLTDQGNQRFTYNYTAPSDGSGLGRYIDVTTTVYSDSGYTTRTGIYADESQTYMVKENEVHLGGGGSVDVDYKKIRTIVKELLDEQEDDTEEVETPEAPEQEDLKPVLSALETRILSAIGGIKIPQPERVDLAPVTDKVDESINTILMAVDSKEVTPETDLTPVLNEIQALPVQELLTMFEQVKEMMQTLTSMVESQAELDQLRTAAEQFTSAIKTKKLPAVKPQENPYAQRARNLLGNPQTV